jgi:cobalt-zinc-cadmium efflux system outer membrane protein
MRTRAACAVVAWLVVTTPVAAQTVLSEAEALARVSTDSPRVRAIRAAAEIARTDVLAAGRPPNPRFTYNREAVAGVTEHMFLVTQPLPVTGRRQLDVRAATALVEAGMRRADDDVRRARAELRTAYADLLEAQTREEEWARSTDRLRGLAEILARREAAGDTAGYDRLRAEREVMDVEADLSASRAGRARAQATLSGFFADPGNVVGLVAKPAESLTRPPLPGVEELFLRATNTRGEAAALRDEIAAARFGAEAAGRRNVPEPEIVAGTKSSNFGGGDLGSVLSIHATLPLFDRAEPERRLAQTRLALAEARTAAFESTLRAQLIALRAEVVERRDAADRHRATASETGSRLERIAEVSYEAGERGILELLDAHRSAASLRLRQASLDAAARHAEIELEFVSGWEIP